MFIPDVHQPGARVMVYPEGLPAYEAIVAGNTGDATSGALDRDGEWYWFTTSKEPQDGATPDRVKRIVRVTMPNGDSFEGVCQGKVTDLDGNMTPPLGGYGIRHLHEPNMVMLVDPAWVQPL